MKNCLLGLYIIANTLIIHSQSPGFKWAKHPIGGVFGTDHTYSVAADAFGNIYATGDFEGTVDFDPGVGVFNLSSNGQDDMFILKLDQNGDFIWAKQIGGSSVDISYSVKIGASGNIYIAGIFFDTVDFDPGPGIFDLSSSGGTFGDVFVLNLDASGNFTWAKRWGAGSNDYAYGLAVDANGYVYTTGLFQGAVDFDPGPGNVTLSASNLDIFVSKLDAAGNYVWARKMGASGGDVGYGITVDPSGSVYTTGHFLGVVDFDPGAGTFNLTSSGAADMFIQKLNSSGNFVWAIKCGSTLGDEGTSITSDENGNLYSTGYFRGTVDFDPGGGTTNLTSSGLTDAYIYKIDTSGNFIYVKKLGGSGVDAGNSVFFENGNIYSTGTFSSTVDMDPGAGTLNFISAGNTDVFISSLTASGNLNWARKIGGDTTDVGNSIYVDASENIYTGGHFNGTSDFNPGTVIYNLNSSGSDDAFIHKMGTCTISNSTTNITSCGDYTSPSGLYTWTMDGTYADTISNASGCDSLITINLTVLAPITVTASATDTALCMGDSVTLTGGGGGAISYTWTGGALDGVVFVPSSTIIYTVTGTAANTCTNTASITVSVYDYPNLIIDATDTSVCIGDWVTLTASGALSYLWNYSIINGGPFMPVTTLNYTVIGTGPAGCIDSASITVSAHLPPNISANVSDYNVCPGQSVTLNGTGAASYIWTGGVIDGIPFFPSGTATYTATGTDIYSCTGTTFVTITVGSPPNTSVTQNGTTLNANLSGATYQWIDCNNSNNPIPGQTGQFFTALANGSYAVIITNNFCSDTSACFVVNNVGINENTDLSIKCFPNPVSGIMIIQSVEKITSIKITTISGIVVLSNDKINGTLFTTDLSSISSGSYLIELSTEQGKITKKIIKID